MKITEKIAIFSAIVSAVAFVLTVIYVYGFSLSIDMDLVRYFNISDYVKFSVCWLPYYLIGPVIGALYAKFEDAVLKPRTIKEVIQSSNTSTLSKMTARVLQYENAIILGGLILCGVSILIASFFKHIDRTMLFVAGVFIVGPIWLILTSLYLRESSFAKEKMSYWQRRSLLFGPLFIFSVFYFGIMAGGKELDSAGEPPTANLEMIIESPSKEGRILFALSQYIVFLERQTKTVEIIPVGQVKDIILIPKNESKEKKQKKK